MDGEELSAQSKEVAKGSFWNLAGSALFYLISFIYSVIVARAVSQDDLGLFYLSWSVVAIIGIFDSLGLGIAIARYAPFLESKGEKSKVRAMVELSYLSVTVTSFILISLLWSQADAIGSIYQNPKLPEALRMLSALMLLTNISGISLAFLRARADIKSMQLFQVTQNALRLAFTLAFFFLYGPGLFSLSAGLVLSHIVTAAITFTGVRSLLMRLPAFPAIAPLPLLGELVSYGLILNVIQIFWSMLFSINSILIGYLTPPSEASAAVAVFSVSSAIASLLMVFPNSIATIFLPIASRLYGKKDLTRMRSVTETAQRWTLFITIPAAIIMAGFSDYLLGTVYGDAFVKGALTMSILVLGLLFRSVSLTFSQIIMAMRLVDAELRVTVLAGLANLALNVLLIPRYGIVGSAAAFSASLMLAAVLLSHYAKASFGFRFSNEAVKLLFCGVLVFLILYISRPLIVELFSLVPDSDFGFAIVRDLKLSSLLFLAVVAAAGISLFVLASILLHCFRKEDIVLMRKILMKIGAPGLLVSLVEKIASSGSAG
jgi:O-antigen/teichoic acid export membrane protein